MFGFSDPPRIKIKKHLPPSAHPAFDVAERYACAHLADLDRLTQEYALGVVLSVWVRNNFTDGQFTMNDWDYRYINNLGSNCMRCVDNTAMSVVDRVLQQFAENSTYFSNPPTPRYMFEQFQRLFVLIPRWNNEKCAEVSSRDLFHEYTFILTYFSMTCQSVGMPSDDVSEFSLPTAQEIVTELGVSIEEIEQYGAICESLISRSGMYCGDAAKDYYDYMIDDDNRILIDKFSFVTVVCSACSGVVGALMRDGLF